MFECLRRSGRLRTGKRAECAEPLYGLESQEKKQLRGSLNKPSES
jgi:hypothetical protein